MIVIGAVDNVHNYFNALFCGQKTMYIHLWIIKELLKGLSTILTGG